jgi:hypothetical protein
MSLPLHLFACKDGLNSDPNIPADEPEPPVEIERMPLVLPIESPVSDTYYNESSTHYQSEYNKMALRRPLPEIPLSSGQGIYKFTEYAFTINSEEAQPVYAMMTGYLFHLRPGDLYGYAFTEAGSFIADIEMLVLEAIAGEADSRRDVYYAASIPVLNACIMRNISVMRETLIEEIGENYPVNYITYKGYESPEAWYEDWLTDPTMRILVKGGSQIGLTKQDQTSSSSPQRLSLFFEIGGWANNEAAARNFFSYRGRQEKLEGHPMTALITELPVQAGYIDYIHPSKEPFAGHSKKDLISAEESGADYDAIAVDPEQHPAVLIIQKSVPQNVTVPSSVHLPLTHGTTKILVRNPLNLPIQITGYDPSQVSISPSSFSTDNVLVEFRATVNSPVRPNNKLDIALSYLDPVSNQSRAILPLTLVFYEFQMIPIKFHKLSDSVQSAQITAPQLEQILEQANHLLGRQTNVYINPVKDEDGVILHDLIFTEELENPLERGDLFNYGLDKIYQRLDEGSTGDNCHHVFAWLMKIDDKLINGGYTWKSSDNPANFFIATAQATGDLSDSYYLQRSAITLIHELGHWFVNRYISTFFCTSGAEHFEHSDCPGGDHQLYENMMTKMGAGLMITINQAEVYVEYSPQLK